MRPGPHKTKCAPAIPGAGRRRPPAQFFVPIVMLMAVIFHCAPSGIKEEAPEAEYFSTPREAVEILNDLLQKEDWKALVPRYYLKGSPWKRSDLFSGNFFLRANRPPAAHPGEFWRYRRPFPPGFLYRSHREETGGIVTVIVGISIDQGGGMVQLGTASFSLLKTQRGYLVLP